MRELAITYQHLVGEEKNIAIAMAGLPSSISSVLHDDVLTFLNRAHKVALEPIPIPEISVFFARSFSETGKRIDSQALRKAAGATLGYPYMLQLVGYYILEYAADDPVITEETVDKAIATSKHSLIESIHKTCLKPLSDVDIAFLEAMSADADASRILDLQERLGVSHSYLQQYRARLIDAGIIVSERRGMVEFVVPYLGEYLRGEL
jgi:hypothetical protein